MRGMEEVIITTVAFTDTMVVGEVGILIEEDIMAEDSTVVVVGTADIDDSIRGLAKYLVAVIKCNENNEESIALVEAKLKELVNHNIDSCINVINAKEKEFGQTAIRVNRITKEIVQEIKKLCVKTV